MTGVTRLKSVRAIAPPDATRLTSMEGTKRLFDLTRGGSFTLLNFGPRNMIEPGSYGATTLNIVEKASASGDVADDEGTSDDPLRQAAEA